MKATNMKQSNQSDPSALRGARRQSWAGVVMALLGLSLLGVGAADKPCCNKELAPSDPLSDRSLYLLESSWTNDAGRALPLASLRGRPQVVSMFFASCQFTCPVLVNDMKRVQSALAANVQTNVGFVLVTFDAERDTPDALAAFRRLHGLPGNWTLLRAGTEDIRELSALLGVKYKRDARGQFAHSNVITVLNSEGEIARQIPGLNRDPAEAVRAIEAVFARTMTVPNSSTDN
jgi:protein SCO1/2